MIDKQENTLYSIVSNSIYTKNKIDDYYFNFCQASITLTREICRKIGFLQSKNTMLVDNNKIPVVVTSISMLNSKIFIHKNDFELLKGGVSDKKKKSVLLKLFFTPDFNKVVSILIYAQISYNNENIGKDYIPLYIEYSRRPSDNLIILLGEFLRINTTENKRKEERINLSPESIKKLKLVDNIGIVTCNEVSRKCMIKDISYSGMNIITPGSGDEYLNKKVVIRLSFEKNYNIDNVEGTVVRYDMIEGTSYLTSLGILLDKSTIPIDYENIITNFFNSKST